jgi:excisionase family DNA binding protein
MKRTDMTELAALIERILSEKETAEPQAAPPLLTAPDVAARLQINVQAVYRLAREGKLPAVQIGTRTRRWTENAVNDFVERGGVREESNQPKALRLAG